MSQPKNEVELNQIMQICHILSHIRSADTSYLDFAKQLVLLHCVKFYNANAVLKYKILK